MSQDRNLRSYQIRIKKGHKLYNYCDEMCLLSKNMYNTANYFFRQVFSGIRKAEDKRHPNESEIINLINDQIPKLNEIRNVRNSNPFKLLTSENPYMDYNLLDGVFKILEQSDYKNMPAHSNQQIIKLMFQDWKSYFNSIKDFKKNPSKYSGIPKIPCYAKKNGRKIAYFSNQTCTIKDDKYLRFPKTQQKLNIGKLAIKGNLKQVRVIPGLSHYVIELVLEISQSKEMKSKIPQRILGIDLGVNNFAAISNNIGEEPIVIKGKVLKSINQYYNKMRAHYCSILRHGKNSKIGVFHSNRLNRLDVKRNAKVKDFLHKASYNIVKYALAHDIDTIIVGKNINFKKDVTIRKDDKQNFINIPHGLFIEILEYKAKYEGINLIINEESYTSKASFLDNDIIPIYGEKNNSYIFSGHRKKRGLYISKNGVAINADTHAAGNIIRKVVPSAFVSNGNRGVVSTPLVLSIA